MGTKEEKNKWNKVFTQEKNQIINLNNLFSSYWWKNHYSSIAKIGDRLIEGKPMAKVVEVGCGSGKNTLLLSQPAEESMFVDISPMALQCVKNISQILQKSKNNIKTCEADMFYLPFADNQYDLCWGVGVLEHYPLPKIISAIKEMLRVTARGGYIAVGFPNPQSLAFKKAEFLGDKRFTFFTKYLKGYRNDTERVYEPDQLLKKITHAFSKYSSNHNISYAGSITLVNTPKIVMQLVEPLEKILYRYKFIYFIVLKKL